ERNVANDLLYSLSKECFQKINTLPAEMRQGIRFPDNFIGSLNDGVCIQVLMTQFSNSNPWVKEVFEKR
ncbi:hypothetical protein ACFL96_13145, partial [Thermoproteota archaeon]